MTLVNWLVTLGLIGTALAGAWLIGAAIQSLANYLDKVEINHFAKKELSTPADLEPVPTPDEHKREIREIAKADRRARTLERMKAWIGDKERWIGYESAAAVSRVEMDKVPPPEDPKPDDVVAYMKARWARPDAGGMDAPPPDGYSPRLTDADLDALLEASEAERKRLAAEFNKHVRENAEAWSAAVVCAVTGAPLPHARWYAGDHGPSVTYTFQGQERPSGEAFVIRCGYGSKHDGKVILLGLSDDALEQLIANGRARVIGEFP